MKKTVLILIAVLPLFVCAQAKFTLNDNTSFNAVIDHLYRQQIIFSETVDLIQSDRIDMSETKSIAGWIPGMYKRAILNQNPSIKFFPRNVIDDSNITSGDYIFKAGTRYITGISLSVAGGILFGVGVAEEHDASIVGGGALMLTGFIAGITGHIQLRKAGHKMNQDAISLSASNNGLGLALNF